MKKLTAEYVVLAGQVCEDASAALVKLRRADRDSPAPAWLLVKIADLDFAFAFFNDRLTHYTVTLSFDDDGKLTTLDAVRVAFEPHLPNFTIVNGSKCQIKGFARGEEPHAQLMASWQLDRQLRRIPDFAPDFDTLTPHAFNREPHCEWCEECYRFEDDDIHHVVTL